MFTCDYETNTIQHYTMRRLIVVCYVSGYYEAMGGGHTTIIDECGNRARSMLTPLRPHTTSDFRDPW